MKESEEEIEQKDSLNELILRKTDIPSISKLEKNENDFIVTYYDPTCEEHFKIDKIVVLNFSCFKIFLCIILSLLTGFLLDLFMIWFPKLKLCFIYKKVNVENAKYVGIYGKDGKFIVAKIKKISLPIMNKTKCFLYNYYKSNIPSKQIIIYFKYKLYDYLYNPNEQSFECLKFTLDTTYNNVIKECSNGLNENEILHQRLLYGVCDLEIKIHSFIKLLFIEFTDPFYIFQVFSIVLWIYSEYTAYACLIIISTLVSLFYGTYETRKNLLNIQQMSRYSCPVNVLRKFKGSNEASLVQINSRELVPGDIFEIQDEGLAMPCDCILIQGTVIINEAMLTGESTPIIKNQIQYTDDYFDIEEDKKNFLYAGTKVVQKRKVNNKKVFGLVTNIGFNTVKGNIIRSILYPKELNVQFQKDSYKYITLMGILCSIGFGISIPFLLMAGISVKEIVLRLLDLVTTAVPPSLPACLGIGISYAVSRLKKNGIICIDRERVNLAGKTNVLCFDKTGTLTEDFLDIYGYRPVHLSKESNNFEFSKFIKTPTELNNEAYNYYKLKHKKNIKDKNGDLNEYFIECLSTCHCATYVKDKLIGDPIDIKMFESSNWILKENINANNNDQLLNGDSFVRPSQEEELNDKINTMKNNNIVDDIDNEIEKIMGEHYEIAITKRFDFSPKLQRMSVITKNNNEPYYKIFCKGSPEKIKELCLEETIPILFNETLNKYTTKGFRVLALAFKMLKMNYIQAQKVKREKIESNLIFLGLLIVQNKLKPETNPTMEILEEAGLKKVMATGDNILTAISVGKECGIINKKALIYSCEIENNQLIWNTINNFNDDLEEPDEFILQKRYVDNNIMKVDKEENTLNYLNENSRIKDENNEILNDYINLGVNSKEKLTNQQNLEINLDKKSASFIEEKCKINLQNKNVKQTHKLSFIKNTLNDSIINNLIKNKKVKKISSQTGIENEGTSFIDFFPPEIYEIIYTKMPNKLNDKIEINKELEINIPNENIEIIANLDDKESLSIGIEVKEYPFKNINDDYAIALTGATFSKLYELKERYISTKLEEYYIYEDIFKVILLHGCIFARMTPEHKELLVECFRKEKFTVIMCGDGANDCMALKAADVGVSLSQEEASIAAPFTSSSPNISCIITLLREGKCSLVTSIQTFKYMMIYSLIQFICVTLMIINYTYLTDWQFLASDCFIIFPLAFFLPHTGPYEKLTKHHPTDSLISFPIIFSILSQTIICFIFQYFGWYLLKIFFDYENICYTSEDDDVYACPDNAVIYLIANMQYLTSALAFNISKPFRKKIYTNIPLLIFIIFAFLYSSYLIIYPDKFSAKILLLFIFATTENKKFNDPYFRFIILGVTIINFIFSYCFEKFLVPLLSNLWQKNKMRRLEAKTKIPKNKLSLAQLMEINESKENNR